MHPIRALRESGHATPELFAALLAEDVVMHSPLLTKAILGRDAVAKTMAASASNRDNPGTYVLERKLDENTTFLHWKGTIEGHEFESMELLTDGLDGKLKERTVAYRPFPALKIFRDKQRAAVGDSIPPDAWDYPAA
ncbi:MAG: hypothetical protein WDM89_02725 [Rhizomicrobium sp.]